MKFKFNILLTATALLLFGCPSKHQDNGITVSPEAGTSYKTGDVVVVQAHYPAGSKPDSVVYVLDSVKIGSKKDTTAFSLKTDTIPLGPRIITAKVYTGGKNQDASTNIVLLPSKAPEEYTFKVEKVFPHDTSCFTEGILYHDGFIYESGGGYLDPPQGQVKDGQSSLRKVDLTTGKVLQKAMVDPKVFGEGISIVGDKIIQLTYHEKIGYVYDKKSFKQLSTFPNNTGVEGWGMCFDGKKLYMDDSTNRIWFLDKDTYRQIGYIDVFDDKGAVNEVNELEYIDGKLYANIWKQNTIIAIDPKTGAVLQRIDLTSLYPENKRNEGADVLNGIAYDAAAKRIFITGKKWNKLFQVSFVKK
ncbi:glutaminyl-peptide cyclotransferase [Mucilaginibacter sp.]|uniref:glutaminyl-peptide cyclotransferase n=1 Tax=Mucilaginibacter sp. TaxID=1882438 RepID=UPI002604708F|nr:glutaminyl-peptide cyclotransferase [Mucilaginibacter sp.]MDB4920299.1 glutamine cyclotransferase [Mucilaginibacter sp.]